MPQYHSRVRYDCSCSLCSSVRTAVSDAVSAFREMNKASGNTLTFAPVRKIKSPFEEASTVPFNIPKAPLAPPAVPLQRTFAIAPAPMEMNRPFSADSEMSTEIRVVTDWRPRLWSPFQEMAMMPMDQSLISTATSKPMDVPPLERTYAMVIPQTFM